MDHLWGDDGRDNLNGGADDDFLWGGSGNDILRGGSGNDFLRGDWGADVLLGESGLDTLFGGGGADTFVFSATIRSQRDVIADFEQGIDRIRIEQFPGGFSALTIRTASEGVEVNAGGMTILLQGQQLSQVDASDFLF